MKTKIEIKHWITGSILFEFECDGNSTVKTVLEAVRLKKDLSGANLSGANLSGADLSGADLSDKKIKTAAVFTGLYTYIVIPYITEDGEVRIKMGCHDRLLSEWDADFWNNKSEFPNDGSVKSECRFMAFETAKKWLQIIQK